MSFLTDFYIYLRQQCLRLGYLSYFSMARDSNTARFIPPTMYTVFNSLSDVGTSPRRVRRCAINLFSAKMYVFVNGLPNIVLFVVGRSFREL